MTNDAGHGAEQRPRVQLAELLGELRRIDPADDLALLQWQERKAELLYRIARETGDPQDLEVAEKARERAAELRRMGEASEEGGDEK